MWEPTIIYLCKTPGRQLWTALFKSRKMYNDSALRSPFPGTIEDCKCKGCTEELEYQQKIKEGDTTCL